MRMLHKKSWGDYLELRRHIAVTGGNAEQERVVFGQRLHCRNLIVCFRWCVHLGEDLRRQGLCNPGYMRFNTGASVS